MALEPIETAQLWVATIAGLAGLAGLLWQVYQHFSGRREESNRTLNRDVLRPWSEVRINHVYDPDQHNGISLVVPKEVLPLSLEEGLVIERLPGLSRGESFLRKHYPDVFSMWAEVVRLREKYANLLHRRRAVVEPMVRRGMAESYASLTPVQNPYGMEYTTDLYVPSRLAADLESSGYWAAGGTELRFRVHMSKTQANNLIYCEYGAGSNPWLKVVEADSLDIDKLTERLVSWILEPTVRAVNKELFGCFKELETTIDTFRTALKEASVNVELTGE